MDASLSLVKDTVEPRDVSDAQDDGGWAGMGLDNLYDNPFEGENTRRSDTRRG